MASGPSKEELQDYYQNNRQYFDSLAKYYADTDREYYNKFIAPFYSTFKSPKGSLKLIVSMMLFIMIMGIAAAVFYITKTEGPKRKDVSEKNREITVPDIKVDTVKPPIEVEKIETLPVDSNEGSEDYEKGMKYYYKLDYTNAEKYFKLVPKNSKKYTQAQKKLFEIDFIKKALDKQTPYEVTPKQNETRKQPLERIR